MLEEPGSDVLPYRSAIAYPDYAYALLAAKYGVLVIQNITGVKAMRCKALVVAGLCPSRALPLHVPSDDMSIVSYREHG
jgi:hypothetical protein